MSTSRRFLELRDLLLRFREDWAGAQREFRWPAFEQFNWAHDYFDVIAAQFAGRFAGLPGAPVRIAVGAGAPGWADYDRSYEAGDRFDSARTRADELLLLYFTSGTTARPKLVAHTQASYPIGHLSTMYWLGLKPGDVHLNLSSPGWAKHAWPSLFAPWHAAATVLPSHY